MSKFYGLDKIQSGDLVKIADRASLEDFARTWKLHHPLNPDQLQFAGQVAKILESSMYHGGDILYQLHDIPGVWHQGLLSKPN